MKMIKDPGSPYSYEEATAAYRSTIQTITDEIKKLNDRARTIHMEIRKAEDAMLSMFADGNDDDIEESRTAHFLTAKIQSQFPGLSDIIRLRLAKSMALRRKRMITKRLCYAGDSMRMTQSQLKDIALEPHEDLIFPLPPSHSPEAIEVMEHVKSDLDPYICLAENCDCPDEIYKHNEDWLTHMRKHASRWVCRFGAHGKMLFDTREDYVAHMKLHHREALTDRRIDVFAGLSFLRTHVLFESCPFCGIEKQDGDEGLKEHVAGHLQYLAIQSLPPANEETNDIASSEEIDYEYVGIQPSHPLYTELSLQAQGNSS
ncbi:hypothetical protein HDV64DRAFT_290196 [Trichoderma sp. TUCIM 5745]